MPPALPSRLTSLLDKLVAFLGIDSIEGQHRLYFPWVDADLCQLDP
jgi:hypothetical protein